jgi:glutamyl-tRNA synthetase
MLSVVVDDHDMGISHIIRGDDHLVNAARQAQLYRALGWAEPAFAHIPLIHGPDGAKLSKRHGALGIDAYREMGFLPAALRNYLLRLGWSHGDEEVIEVARAIEWFDLDAVGRGAARFDMAKLTSLNAHYLRAMDDAELARLVAARLAAAGHPVDDAGLARLVAGMAGLKPRATTLVDLAERATFYVATRPLALSEKALRLLQPPGAERLAGLLPALEHVADWQPAALEAAVRAQAEAQDVELGQLAQPLRAALTGGDTSPGIFEVMAVLGREEVLGRIADAIGADHAAVQHDD